MNLIFILFGLSTAMINQPIAPWTLTNWNSLMQIIQTPDISLFELDQAKVLIQTIPVDVLNHHLDKYILIKD